MTTPDPLQLVDRSHRYLAGIEGVYTTPSIPPKKLANALTIHTATLPSGEPVLVLYDDTVFGSAKDGFLLTSRGIYWRNLGEDPRFIEWAQISAEMVRPSDAKVLVGGAAMSFSGKDDEQCARLAGLLGEIARELGAGPFRSNPSALPSEPPDPPDRNDELILELAGRSLAGTDGVHLAPSIPVKKEHNLREALAGQLQPDERILVLHDNTLFGSAKDGYAITRRAIAWKNAMSEPKLIEWRWLSPEEVRSETGRIYLKSAELWVAELEDVARCSCDLILQILALPSGDGGGPHPVETAMTPDSSPPLSDLESRCPYCEAKVGQDAKVCWNCDARL